ncbi:MAG: hypothetical protein MUE65_02365 [Methanomassiliicoccales archaeon]|nr:hypothetical protein [Methanomassiliicoccales archaeon]
MKVALACRGPTLEDELDDRFGRCRYLLITDDEGHVHAMEAGGPSQDGGAGVRMSQMVIDSGAQTLIGAEPGPKAMRPLRMAGVRIYVVQGMTAGEALANWRAGGLAPIREAEANCTEDVVIHGLKPSKPSMG